MSEAQEAVGTVGLRGFKPYPAYKDSGVEWLGELPAGWELRRLRYVTQLNPSKREARGLDPALPVSFVPMEAVGEFGGLALDAVRPLAASLDGYTYFRDGDVVVAKITPCFENGKGALAVGLENGIGCGTTELHVLRAGPRTDSRFLFYLTLGDHFRRLGAAAMYGAGGQKRVPEDFIRDLKHPLPSETEQRAIAAFLDRETARIDALVAKKERLIELLQEKRAALITRAVTKGVDPSAPMKDSGVPWLGEIPAHWHPQVLKGGLATLEQGWSPLCENRPAENEEWGVLKVGCVNGTRFDHTENKALPSELEPDPSLEIKAGDILLSRANTRELLGSASLVRDVRPRLLLCDKLYRIRFIPDRLDAEFVVYQLGSSAARYQMERDATGASGSMQNIAQGTIRNLVVPEPPLAEQRSIAEFIHGQELALDALTAKVLGAIDRLKELRTALISAAVTGKIDVRGLA